MTKDQLLAYSLAYDGESSKIRQALMRNEPYQPISGVFSAITILDDTYPECLRTLREPPYVLYYKGDLSLLSKEAIAVVGSRNMKNYAESMTIALISQLAQRYVIVSGLAKGVDACAHNVGLAGSSTIAVLGCGIDRIYPAENSALYHLIETQGLILSEYPNQAHPLKHRFPCRNRIVAALGKALVVMQADHKSGSMITVSEALDLGKDVYTIPYDLTRLEGQGCNLLIQQGANMILSDDDLMSI
jgi:DNA processing protein